MNTKNKVKILVQIIIIIILLGTIFNISVEVTDYYVDFVLSAIIGIITSAVAASFVERLNGNVLKKIFLTFEIKEFKFSISVFVIVTFLVKIWLF